MKNKLTLIALSLLIPLTLSAKDNKNQVKKKNSETVTFIVSIYCDNCKKKIEKNISWEKGVKDLSVSLERKTVTIVYNPEKNKEEELRKAIEKLGYSCQVIGEDQ